MWDASLYKTSWIFGTSRLVRPDFEGLSVGTWYWRICAAWSSDGLFPTCYLTSAGGVLDVVTAESIVASNAPLSLAAAKQGARWVGMRKFRGRYVGAVCVKHSVSQALCYVRMKRNGKGYARYVYLSNDSYGDLSYSLTGF